MNQIKCPECNRIISQKEILSSKDYSYNYDLEEMIKHSINKFGLKEQPVIEERLVRRELNEKKEDVLFLSAHCDGIPVFGNCTQLWIIQFKVEDLNSREEESTFLHSSYVTTKKPKAEFIFENMVNELNTLFEKGVFIEKLNKVVFPALTKMMFDLGCKYSLTNRSNFNGEFGCFDCYAPGERIPVGNGTARIYRFSNYDLRTADSTQHDTFLVENGFESAPFKGIKGKNVLSRLSYITVDKLIINETMHSLFCNGHIQRSFKSMQNFNFRNYNFFIPKEFRFIIDSRINNLNVNSFFKRNTSPFTNINDWKANQVFDFFFYLSLHVLDSFLPDIVYKSIFLIIYIINKLWSGCMVRELDELDNLVKLYLKTIENIYPNSELTINLHQVSHLIKHYRNHGSLSNCNAFIFESLLGIIKKLVKSPYGIMEQISSNFELIFFNRKPKDKDLEFRVVGKSYKENNLDQERFKKIQKNKTVVTSYDNSFTKIHDYYVETNNFEFFKVLYYIKENNTTFAIGQKFRKVCNLSNVINNQRLELDYISKVKLTEEVVKFSVNDISKKVIFLPEFHERRAVFKDTNTGLIVNTKHVVHN
jgi:hypothetical protein